ncbi:MAG: ATP-binding protein [Rhodopirellula sp.]|nr:ATP-binding protein [Rhodopirellula sp.]
MTELKALKAIDFDWTVHLKSVWMDQLHDVPALQQELRNELAEKLADLGGSPERLSPLGWPIVGSGGTGKTHLVSVLRRMALDRGIAFVLVDMTDVHDFWETVLLGYLGSLQQECGPDRFQFQWVLERFLGTLKTREPAAEIVQRLGQVKTEKLAEVTRKLLGALGRKHPRETLQHQDVIRALMALNSEDFEVSSTGLTWLQGHPIEEETQRSLGFTAPVRRPLEIVAALSWLMSLAGPTVLALDQLDPIVTHLNIAAGGADFDGADEEIRVARSIIEKIAAGLGALRDVTERTLIVVSCLETTWDKLSQHVALATNLDRYEPARYLQGINRREQAEAVFLSRLTPAYRKADFRPPYPTWPFAPAAFEGVQGVSPRQLLKFGYQHVRHCLDRGEVTEVHQFSPRETAVGVKKPTPRFPSLDARFDQYRSQAAVSQLLDEKADDARLAPLLQTACRCLVRESRLPLNIEAVVDVDFHGGKTTRPLHARIRLIHHEEGEREEHFCLRAIERANARAFQARLNAAMIQSGIDRRLGFRHLAVLRASALPGGPITGQLVKKFDEAGGVFLVPDEETLRTLWALAKLDEENDSDLLDWLRHRRPVSQLDVMRLAAGRLCSAETQAAQDRGNSEAASDDGSGAAAAVAAERAETSPVIPTMPRPVTTGESRPPASPRDAPATTNLTLGWRWIGERPVEPVCLPVSALEKHTVILAGAGSGKTVLIRRLVEEVALLGIPSIVIDCANDLVTLGDRWPQSPENWLPGDAAKADAYFAETEVLVWTPGREAGNPLCLEPLPDLAAVADDPDELTATVEMVRESLQKIVAPGAGASSALKLGILSSALRFFAHHGGGTLNDFVRFLKDMPEGAGPGVQNEAKHARDMADRLKVEVETNVLLRDGGTMMDPALLFGDVPGNRKVRISVVNFAGLGLESQRQFLNQLAMTLFSWIKKRPGAAGRPLRGLLVIDEAKDFVPSGGSTACKPSLMRLAAQARKYHLGLVLATQNPREIENTMIGNCSTHYYGKAGSPAAIQVVREQIHLRGGSGDDVPALPKGTFYVFNSDAKMAAPVKVRLPMCLSHHWPNPLDEPEILRRAAASRQLVDRRGRPA